MNRCKILVIEDNRKTRRLVEYNLQQEGYKVVTAENGAEGLATAELELPDLIILDVMMPGMDGFKVAKTLRATQETAKTPIIFLTARSGMGDKLFGFKSGGDDYLTKPFNIDELNARIKAILKRQQP